MRRSKVSSFIALAAGSLAISGCASNIDQPAVFSADITVAGADGQVDLATGRCTFDGKSVGPNDLVSILGDSVPASTRANLEAPSADLPQGGVSQCIFVARFDAVPENQRSYSVSISSSMPGGGEIGPEEFTSDQLKSGATFWLP